MRNLSFSVIFILILSLSSSLCAKDDAPEVTSDGLHRVPDTQLGFVYAAPDADLGVYSKLLLIDPHVAFRKDWQRDINQGKPYNVTTQDMVKIRTELAALFSEILVKALEESNHALVSEQAADVLIIRPAILDLNITSPDIPSASRTQSITRSAGDMTLYLELRDSVTGAVLAKALDHQIDDSRVVGHMRDSSRNEEAARNILEGWVEIMVNGLDETMEVTSGR
jgi:hypothetical protein